MRRASNILAVTLLHAALAWGSIGTLDQVPAATLLLPYFEVGIDAPSSFDGPEAATTVFTITNLDAASTIASVTLWTDLAVPTFRFNLYLTGFDTATVDLRLLFAGFIEGARFSDCNTPRSVLTAAEIDHLRRAHTGRASAQWSGSCGAVDHGDQRVRGFVTVDVANICDQTFPGEAGYFVDGGSGIAANNNMLTGEYTIIDRQNNFSSADSMVHLEASSTDAATSTSGNYTFYGRLIGWSAADNREPAAGWWWNRYLNGGVFDGGTAFLVWRDPGTVVSPFFCAGGPPAPFPLTEKQLVAFDEEENGVDITGPQDFPWATMRKDTRMMSLPFSFGTMFLNLYSATSSGGPPSNPAARQSVVTGVFSTSGRFQTAMSGFAISSAGD